MELEAGKVEVCTTTELLLIELELLDTGVCAEVELDFIELATDTVEECRLVGSTVDECKVTELDLLELIVAVEECIIAESDSKELDVHGRVEVCSVDVCTTGLLWEIVDVCTVVPLLTGAVVER